MGIIKDIVMPIELAKLKSKLQIGEIQQKGQTDVETTHSKLPDVIKAGAAAGVASGLSRGLGSSIAKGISNKGNKKDDNDNNKNKPTPPKVSVVVHTDAKAEDVWKHVRPETVSSFRQHPEWNPNYPSNWSTWPVESKAKFLDTYAQLNSQGKGLSTLIKVGAPTSVTIPLINSI